MATTTPTTSVWILQAGDNECVMILMLRCGNPSNQMLNVAHSALNTILHLQKKFLRHVFLSQSPKSIDLLDHTN